jgi:bacterioferritin
MSGEFVSDVKAIRRRARTEIEKGAVTPGYKGQLEVVIRLLNSALATELVCVLRYRRHYYMAKGIHSRGVAEEFLEHAGEEQEHADQIAARIIQLGGAPDFNPESFKTRSHTEYIEGETLLDMLKEDLVAERIAIESYNEMITFIGDTDSTTRTMLEGILATEEEHAEDLANLLAFLEPKGKHRTQEAAV